MLLGAIERQFMGVNLYSYLYEIYNKNIEHFREINVFGNRFDETEIGTYLFLAYAFIVSLNKFRLESVFPLKLTLVSYLDLVD